MYSFRIVANSACQKLIIRPSFLSRAPLVLFLLIWTSAWSMGTIQTLRFVPPPGAFTVMDAFSKVLFSVLWLLGVATLIYVLSYKEEIVFRAGMIETKFCVIIKMRTGQLPRSAGTRLTLSEEDSQFARVNVHTEDETLSLFYGTTDQSRQMYNLIVEHIPDLKPTT